MIEAAQKCVQCGLCLSVCPTYQHSLNEADSPRGRIALLKAQAWQSDYLKRCLYCARCEPVCPVQIPFTQLMDQGFAHRPRFFISPRWLNRWTRPWLRLIPRFKPILAQFNMNPIRIDDRLPASKGKVLLAIGCSAHLESDTVQSAIELIQQCGYQIELDASCCGALAAHHGQSKKAEEQKKYWQAQHKKYDRIISLNSGCGAYWQSYMPHQDVMSFLNEQDLNFRPLAKTISLHLPCSLQTLKTEHHTLRLLHKIPQIEIECLDECCGAGGTQWIYPSHLNHQLAQHLIKQKKTQTAFSPNISCRIHLSLHDQSQWQHPILLLAHQLNKKT